MKTDCKFLLIPRDLSFEKQQNNPYFGNKPIGKDAIDAISTLPDSFTALISQWLWTHQNEHKSALPVVKHLRFIMLSTVRLFSGKKLTYLMIFEKCLRLPVSAKRKLRVVVHGHQFFGRALQNVLRFFGVVTFGPIGQSFVQDITFQHFNKHTQWQ